MYYHDLSLTSTKVEITNELWPRKGKGWPLESTKVEITNELWPTYKR